MVAVTLVFHASESAFVRWCADWWWIVVFAGGLLMLAVSAAQFLFPLRCPACGFGLHHLGLHPPMLVLRSTPVRYCAHCGADFHQPEPVCAADVEPDGAASRRRRRQTAQGVGASSP